MRKLRTYDFISQTTANEHPSIPSPFRWPALTTLPTLATFQLGWRRLCHVLCPSCLVKHVLTHASLSIEYRFQVTRVAPSTLQVRSKGRPFLPPPCLASSLLPFLLRPLCLASSFLSCLTPPPCLASSSSSALPRFLPPSLPPFPSFTSPPSRRFESSCKASTYAIFI